MVSKPCIKCGAIKPLCEFYPHKQMKDGHLNMCKDCSKLEAKRHRAANADLYRAYERTRSVLPHRRALADRIQAAWRGKHPERRAANLAVQYALRAGRLTPLPCWVCGEKAEAHHPDYSMPLDVVWLCPRHHKQLHAMVA